MAWWVWVLFAIGLLVVELVTPGGLFALFFGVGALLVAVLAAAGVGATWQWLAFSAVSVALLITLRRPVQDRMARRSGGPVDSLVGEEVVLLQDLAGGDEGAAELHGAPWRAREVSGAPLRAGQRCRVERVEGLLLWVRAA